MALYNLNFEPILQRGHTVTLFGSSFNDTGDNFRCSAVDALPTYVKDFSTLTAATWSSEQEDTNLELDKRELVQMRLIVVDDVRLRLKNPGPVSKWRTAKTRFYLTQFPTEANQDWLKEYMFCQSEFFYWEDTTPRFELYSALGVSESRVKFTGWRFKMEPIKVKGAFELLVDGWPGTR